MDNNYNETFDGVYIRKVITNSVLIDQIRADISELKALMKEHNSSVLEKIEILNEKMIKHELQQIEFNSATNFFNKNKKTITVIIIAITSGFGAGGVTEVLRLFL